MLTDWAIKKLEHLTMDYMKLSCAGKECYGFVAVHRMNFALGFFHFILAILLLGVNSSRDKRAPIQNSFWGPKIIAWLGLIVVTFFIPDAFFATWGNYVAFVGAMLFLLLGLVLLVDLAHTWAEHCLDRIDATESKGWQALLIGSTLSMYLAALAMTIVMYIFFAGDGCSMNQAAITINLLFSIGITVLSIHPTIQSYNSRAGLCQSSMVAVYCTYLTMSAVGMEPDNKCNPIQRANGARTASIIGGAILTFLTMAWTTTRAATMGLSGSQVRSGYSSVPADEEYSHTLVTQQPTSRRELRESALRAAVESGSLPASALDDDYSDSDDEDSSSGTKKRDDERSGTQYNYALFHVIFLLSTMWVATLLTQNVKADSELRFVPVGRSYWASWVKIVSSWVCYAIYSWSLAAPAILPDRFDY
jgi:hypothetical protein